MGNGVKLVAILLTLVAIVLTACGPAWVGGTERTIYVGPELVDCEGAGPQKCMLVKENLNDDWSLFYDQIEGFEYEAGYEYKLKVREEEVKDPPADASSIQWTLVEVMRKTEVARPSAGLEGPIWLLDSYVNSQGQTVEVPPGSEITARFQDGEVGGNAGCNSYTGQYELDGNSLSIGPVAMTEMYCMPEELMALESDYLTALQQAAAVETEEDQMQILDASGQTLLTFSPLKPSSLVGTLWEMSHYDNGTGGFSSALSGTEITAVFGEDGNLGGSAGCNNYSTSYHVSGNQITIGAIASTMMMCPEPGIMEQEGAYLTALQSAAAFEIEGQQLTLFNAEGGRAVTYTVREPTPLVGTDWQLGWYNNGRGGFTSLLVGTQITAVFGEDGNVAGSAGCNNYSAGYEVDGSTGEASGSISIGPAATTRMMCAEPEGIMQQESEYLAALQSAASYQIEGDKLVLLNAEGSRAAEYSAQLEAAGASEGLSEEALMNMEYQSEWTESGTAPLTNGEYSEPVAPHSATETVVRLLPEYTAYGQLNGQPAAAVILVTDPGGSGTFLYLAVVVEQEGQPVNIATTSLGDRAQINSASIENNQIVVDMITHGPDDPMCCPTQHVVQTYELQGDQLVQTSSKGASSGVDSGLEIVGVLWKWEQFLESNDNTVIVPDPDRYTLEFLPDGQIQVHADCNNASGTYTVQGNQMSIELGPMTMAACPPGSLSDEYVRLLQDVNSFMMDGDNLALAIKYDTGVMKFAPGE